MGKHVGLKSINNYFKSSHHGKITVYLDRIHQYLCAVKFWKDPCSIKEVAHDQAHDHVHHSPCTPSPMCSINQGAPSLSLVLTMIPICPCVPLPMCPIVHMSKKISSCQKDVKCQKFKHMDYGGGSQKNKLT